MPDDILDAALALLPLAPITNVAADSLPGVIQRMEARIDSEARPEDRSLLWGATWLLLGLKYDSEFSQNLLKGVAAMKESSTYQYTLEEGRVEGRLEEARRMLFLFGSKRLGDPDARTRTVVDNMTSQQLEQLALRIMEVESWDRLLG